MEDMAYEWQMKQLGRRGDASRVVGNRADASLSQYYFISTPLPGTEHLNSGPPIPLKLWQTKSFFRFLTSECLNVCLFSQMLS